MRSAVTLPAPARPARGDAWLRPFPAPPPRAPALHRMGSHSRTRTATPDRGRHQAPSPQSQRAAHSSHAAGVALIDVDRRRAGVWRANLGMGTQITGVTHQEEAGDLAEHIGYPL